MDLIHIHSDDNVAVSKAPLVAGTLVNWHGSMMPLATDVPAMHKVSVCPIAAGQAIIKYGQVIGFALEDIAPGTHVHVHNMEAGNHQVEHEFCKDYVPTTVVPEQERATFMGYRRATGKVGTRNYLAVVSTVNCSVTVSRAVAAHFTNSGMLRDFPNIDGIVALGHESGCGMSTAGEGYQTLLRTLHGYIAHPNFAGVLLIGLGCEAMQITSLLRETGLQEGESFQVMSIQQLGGTRAAIEAGIAKLTEMLPAANACEREPIPASELTLAVQCGGSDAYSGITANAGLGAAADILVRQGGTVIYSETPEIYGAEHLLTRRAASPEVAQKLVDRIHWWEHYTEMNGVELNNNPSPGNKAGGLTTIAEKSLGAQAKGGTTALQDVYLYGEQVRKKGLVFMDSPGFDPVSVTGQVASGANVVCFTTGRGSAFGGKPVPSIKLASNSNLFERMREDMDVDCGGILDKRYTVQECGEMIFKFILAIASGEQSASEKLDYGNNEFAPWHIGAVV
ncbi:altronate dehydratase family protein [Microbulbifer bruguierae]|uniref:Altronate dehydratase family protein n=1 Tax=Microbulbifer bruguierae TaxID=3029061 RepID=A0ABY8NA17_9GAMM|nr:altronate dehydratase family protein [Microbulbifer bruguierae]WGL15749.1 altronate dehydratase family protein [Microbulbifer bruguierae]